MLSRLTNDRFTQDDIGIARILHFFLIIASFSSDQLTRYSQFAMPFTCSEQSGVWFEVWLSLEQSTSLVAFVYIAAFCAMVGLFTRISMLVTTLSLLVLLLNAWKFCFFNHSHLPLLLTTLFWTLLDDGSSYRMDRIIWWNSRKPADSPSIWLPFVIRSYFCIIFFLTGVAKLRSGFDWITEDSLRHMLIVQNFAHAGFWWSPWFTKLNLLIVSQLWLCRAMAVFTVVVELAAPLALFSKRLRNWIVVDLALLQIGIFIVMYINFAPWSVLYVFWLPLAKIRKCSRF